MVRVTEESPTRCTGLRVICLASCVGTPAPPLTSEFIDERIDSVVCRATPEILADVLERAGNDEYLSRVEELRAFVDGRRRFLGVP